jgi:spore coat polysaccharide biosynthesis predicted glycosyltransferase SpsG
MVSPSGSIFFRVDGGRSVGMGHVVRCLFLARALRDLHGYLISFLMNRDAIGIARVRESGWPIVQLGVASFAGQEHDDVLGAPPPDDGSIVDARFADALIIDLPGGVSAKAVRALREKFPRTLTVLIDTNCSGCVEADLVVGPMESPSTSPGVKMRGVRFEGARYAILDPAFAQVQRPELTAHRLPRVLVTMGGSDPYGLTLQALRALDAMPEEFETTVALGPAFLHEPELREWLRGARRKYEIRRENSLLGLVGADLAIFSFATTAYELAAAGLPAVALAISRNHSKDAEVFSRNGSIVNLGWFSEVSAEQIQSAVRQLLNDPARRLTMTQRGRELVDGEGAERVAELIASRIRTQYTSQAEGGIGTSQRT